MVNRLVKESKLRETFQSLHGRAADTLHTDGKPESGDACVCVMVCSKC